MQGYVCVPAFHAFGETDPLHAGFVYPPSYTLPSLVDYHCENMRYTGEMNTNVLKTLQTREFYSSTQEQNSVFVTFGEGEQMVPSFTDIGQIYSNITRDHEISRHLGGSQVTRDAITWSLEEELVEALQREVRYHPTCFMEEQPEVNAEMRGILVQWLIQLMQKFEYSCETLFLTVNLVDRFLATTPVSRDCLQLLGVTAFFIAAKQTEVLHPPMLTMLDLCDGLYNVHQMARLELLLLQRLGFGLMVVTPAFFLNMYATWWKNSTTSLVTDHKTLHGLIDICKKVSECVLQESSQDYNLCQYPPSMASLASLCVAWRHLVSSNQGLHALVAVGPELILPSCISLTAQAGLNQQGVATIFNMCISDLASRQDIFNAIPWEAWLESSVDNLSF